MESSERKLRAAMGSHLSWAATPDRAARTANARAALQARFLAEADGDPVRADSLRKAHFARLALASARGRRRAREAAQAAAGETLAAEAAEAELRGLGGIA